MGETQPAVAAPPNTRQPPAMHDEDQDVPARARLLPLTTSTATVLPDASSSGQYEMGEGKEEGVMDGVGDQEGVVDEELVTLDVLDCDPVMEGVSVDGGVTDAAGVRLGVAACVDVRDGTLVEVGEVDTDALPDDEVDGEPVADGVMDGAEDIVGEFELVTVATGITAIAAICAGVSTTFQIPISSNIPQK